jgi:hypothetical protein
MPNIYLPTIWRPNLALACLMTSLCSCIAFGQGNAQSLIQGAVSNEKGEPIPNARVDISTAEPISGPAIFCPSCYLDCQKWTTTGKAGNFEIADLDSRLKFRLVVSAAGYKTAQTELIVPGKKIRELVLRERPDTVDPLRTVSGVVKTDTGIPIQGALVDSVNTIGKDGLRWFYSRGVSPAVTDAKGYFEIDLVDGVFGVDVEIAAEGLSNRMFIGLYPNTDRQAFELFEGASVTGLIKSNGRPVQGMTVSVAQTDQGSRGEKFFRKAIPLATDAQGRFEFKNLFPDQEYCVYTVIGEADRSDSAEIISTQKFVTPPNGKNLHIGDLTTVAPVSLSGRLVSSQIDTFEDLTLSLKRHPAWDLIEVPVARDGSFQINGLPSEVYEIIIASKKFVLDAGKIDALLWTEKSIKRFIDKSTHDFVLPICSVERANKDTDQEGTRILKGRLLLTGGRVAAGIQVSVNDGWPRTVTADDGSFSLEIPATADWVKLHRPDPDEMSFWYLGRFKPNLGDEDVIIRLGPETTFEPKTLSLPRE